MGPGEGPGGPRWVQVRFHMGSQQRPALALTLVTPSVIRNRQTNAAMVVGMGLYTVLNYFGQRFFAFKKTESEDTDDHVAD